MSPVASVPYGYCHCGCGEKTAPAKTTRKHLGLRAGEPNRYILGHRNRRPAEERFWEKVDRTGTCWLWTGSLSNGYGYIRPKNGEPMVRAHRFAYELLVGPIPEGLHLDHLCRVRHCVNPDHLEPVTQAVNTLRGFGACAQHARKTHCVHGHEFNEENTAYRGGERVCRACANRRNREYRERLKVAA